MTRTLLCFGLAAIAFTAVARANNYDLADLDALAKQAAWQELLDHADNIAPSQRTAHWSELVEQAAVGMVSELDTERLTYTALPAVDELARRYPVLKHSKPFMAKRANVGLRVFTRCFDLAGDSGADAKMCGERLAGFADADPDNLELARQALGLIESRIHFRSAAPFTIYYRLIRNDKKQCSNDGAKWAVIEALALDKSDARVAQARELASTTCWGQMQNQLVDALTTAHDGAHYFENSCGFLVDKKALATLQTNRCKALPK